MEPRHFDYVDALRGYAILLVIAVHTSQYFQDLSYPVRTLADQGARGVQLFFVASALTLCMSWKDRHDGALPFYIRRFFRIAPMFYVALVFFVFNGHGISLRHILMTATFTHGLMPDTINSLVPGSWSVADEMMFYALFPLLFAGLSRVRFFPAAVATTIVVCLLYLMHRPFYQYESTMADPVWRAIWGDFTFLWLPQQLPCFLFGMLVFKWTDEGRTVKWPQLLAILSVVAMVGLAFFPRPPIVGRLGFAVQYGFLFALFTLGLMHWQPRALVNPVICWVGKVSFSGYLIHLALLTEVLKPPANFGQSFVIIATATIALSSITYLSIEQPFNRLGRRLARRLTAGRNSQAAEPIPITA